MLQSQHEREKTDIDDINFYSNQRANALVKAIVACATVLLLVVPIVVLHLSTIHQASGGTKIGALLLRVVAFAIALATLTRAGRHEMFVASAAWANSLPVLVLRLSLIETSSRYCAVLVIFIGNFASG